MTKEETGQGERLYLKVARLMTQGIENGLYRKGSRMPAERELAETYKVSRPVIREAMIVLETRGLIALRSNGGTVVASDVTVQPSLSGASDQGPFEVTEARRLLEGEVAALAASIITDDQIRELESTLVIMGDAAFSRAERENADRAFHTMLANVTENDVLASMVESLWDQRYNSPLCIYFFQRAREHRAELPADEHRMIIEALKQGDPDGARQAMREHLSQVTQSLLVATEEDARERARLRVSERGGEIARRASIY